MTVEELLTSFMERFKWPVPEEITTDPLWSVIQRQFVQFLNIMKLVGASTVDLDSSMPGFKQITGDTKDEMLRVIVVFSHASLEEMIREVARRRIGLWSVKLLNSVPLQGTKRRTSFKLADLRPHLNEGVDDVLKRSIKLFLQTKSFNSCRSIIGFLRQIEIDLPKLVEASRTVIPHRDNPIRSLESLIKRRHQIVHSQDYDPNTGERAPIDRMETYGWVECAWFIIVVIIVEEVRRKDSWREAFRRFHDAVVTWAESVEARLIAALIRRVGSSTEWPFLMPEDTPPVAF